MGRSATWIPDRQEVVWIDCDPPAGREMHTATSIHMTVIITTTITAAMRTAAPGSAAMIILIEEGSPPATRRYQPSPSASLRI